MTKVSMKQKLLPAFYSFWRASRDNKHLYYVLKGGRNSSKSTHISIDMIYDLMKLPVNMLAIRKVGNTLESSVYEQLIWAIDHLNVGHLFHINKSPLKITYTPRGNSIIFRGADKPEKIKSIKSSKFPIARLWVEEIAEFKTEDEITTIVNSIVRAELPNGLNYKIYYSYNPPKRKQNWANKKFESNFVSENIFVHHSSYLDNPFVSNAFIDEAEHVKKTKPPKYRWEYMGEAIGAGVVPFTNLNFRTISDNEMDSFDNIRQGLDWGYGADPLAFIRMHYDKTRRKLYLLDEFYQIKTSNREIAAWLKERGYHIEPTICDSAEPKSIDELKVNDVKAKGAKKGQGSVEHGEKWLDDLEEIIIDPRRTPNAAKEFEDIDYQVDKDGNLKNKLEDSNNHIIDATRYGCEDDMRHKRAPKAVKSIM